MKYIIDSYSFGRIQIDGNVHNSDLIITPDQIYTNWWRIEGHNLHIKDFNHITGNFPTILVIGTGAYGQMKVRKNVLNWLTNDKGLEIRLYESKEATKVYNLLKKEGKNVGLAIHLTC